MPARNNYYTYLNEIPFADHGALLDPPTEDVSARCLMLRLRNWETRRSTQRRKESVWNTFFGHNGRTDPGTVGGEQIIFMAPGPS